MISMVEILRSFSMLLHQTPCILWLLVCRLQQKVKEINSRIITVADESDRLLINRISLLNAH